MALKPHIVVVDDEPDIRASIAEYLGIHGFEVSTADGGPAARRILDLLANAPRPPEAWRLRGCLRDSS